MLVQAPAAHAPGTIPPGWTAGQAPGIKHHKGNSSLILGTGGNLAVGSQPLPPSRQVEDLGDLVDLGGGYQGEKSMRGLRTLWVVASSDGILKPLPFQIPFSQACGVNSGAVFISSSA